MDAEILYRDFEAPAALSALIERKARALSRFYRRVERCRVVVAQRRHFFKVQIDLHVPGGEILVHESRAEDAFAAVRDAFHALRRRLEDHARLLRTRSPRKRIGAVLQARTP